MENDSIIKFQEKEVLKSWEIFKISGDIFDAMELMKDLKTLDLLIKEESLERE